MSSTMLWLRMAASAVASLREELIASPCSLPRLQLKDLKQELGGLRVAKVTGGAPNKLSKM